MVLIRINFQEIYAFCLVFYALKFVFSVHERCNCAFLITNYLLYTAFSTGRQLRGKP